MNTRPIYSILKQTSGFFILFTMSLFLISSCKKEDKEEQKPDIKQSDSLKIEGQWQFDEIQFPDKELKWKKDVEFSFANYFGYAPAMFADMIGFDFMEKKYDNSIGSKFLFINVGGYNQNDDKDNWYWNYTNDSKGFEIMQINPSMPPYNFSILNISDIALSDNNNTLTFKAEVKTRLSGGEFTNMINTPVIITLKRELSNKKVRVLIDNTPFTLLQTLEEQILGLSWKLEPGSNVYDPGANPNPDESLEYSKLIAFQLNIDNKLLYRTLVSSEISVPMEFNQDQLNKKIIKTKHGGSNGVPEKIISWQVTNIDLEQGKLTLKESKSGAIRNFIKCESIDEGINKSDYVIMQ